MTPRAVLPLSLGGLVLGCSNTPASAPAARHDAGADVALPSYLPDLDAIVCRPTLDSLRHDVFGVACAFDSCHGDNNAAWGLYLGLPDLESELVDVPSATCRGWTRVIPGAPAESFLVRKVLDDHPPCGKRMPFGLPRLPPHVAACITGWIESLQPRRDGSVDSAVESGAGAPPDGGMDAAGPSGNRDAR